MREKIVKTIHYLELRNSLSRGYYFRGLDNWLELKYEEGIFGRHQVAGFGSSCRLSKRDVWFNIWNTGGSGFFQELVTLRCSAGVLFDHCMAFYFIPFYIV